MLKILCLKVAPAQPRENNTKLLFVSWKNIQQVAHLFRVALSRFSSDSDALPISPV